MTPEFHAAGLSILRYVYETCELHGVQKGDIVELLTELRDAVLIGQRTFPLLPDATKQQREWRGNWTIEPATINAMHAMKASGMSNHAIAKALGIAHDTVTHYLTAGTINVAKTPPAVLPQSNGATDRRADDSVPPKV